MRKMLLGLLVALCPVASVAAQTAAPVPTVQVIPAVAGEQISLPNLGADVPDTEQWNRVIDQVWVRNVSCPSLYRVAPGDGRGNGRAVIVMPGGGYSFVSIESEGFRVAERLAARGYTAFVLKYRPRPTPEAPAAFMEQVLGEWADMGAESEYDHPPAVADLAAAVALVHQRASDWNLDPGDIGVIGFSAGALSTVRLLQQHEEEAALLDNVALIYPPMPWDMVIEPRLDLFMAIAIDDPLFQRGHLQTVADWAEEGRDVEFHLYSGGSHGFGMVPQGTTSDLWIDQYVAWLERP